MKNCKKNYWKLQQHLNDVISIKTSPHEIALGFSIGTIISILPTPGFNILIGFMIILIYKNISKISLFGAMALFNPLVLIPFYMLSYWLGGILFVAKPVYEFELLLLNEVIRFTRRFLVGNLIVALVSGILSYGIVWYISSYLQKRRWKRSKIVMRKL